MFLENKRRGMQNSGNPLGNLGNMFVAEEHPEVVIIIEGDLFGIPITSRAGHVSVTTSNPHLI